MPELSELFKGRDAFVPTVPPFPGQRDTTRYQVSGTRVPSVTEILDFAGLSDFSRIPKDVLENAANRGKWAHYFCERISHGIDGDELTAEFEIPEEVEPRLEAYRKFLAESRFEAIEVEHVVVSTARGYAGTVDLIGNLPGVGLSLIDVKLPILAAASWKLQTAGYALAYEHQANTMIQARYSLQLSKEGRYNLTPHQETYTDTHDFLAAVRVAHFKIRNGIAKLED